MKMIIQKEGALLILVALLAVDKTFAQSGPPALPPIPDGVMLDAWRFSGTNYLSLRRSAPTSLTNVALVPTWDGNGLQVDDTNAAAWITYPVVEPNGHTNLNLAQGTVEMWFAPDWNSGDGLGAWGTILEVGAWNTNLSVATGAWGLYLSPDSSGLFFSAQTNGVVTNYLNASIAWNAGEWHQILVTYSATNSALYLEGAFVTNGPGVSVIPSAEVLSNGFSVGSDGNTGLLQSRGIFNQLITYNYQLDEDTISANYAYDTEFVSPLPSSGGRFGTYTSDVPSPPGDGGGGTNDGGGWSFESPTYGSNDFWVEALTLGTNSYNTDSNSLTLLIHGTTNYDVYELLSTTNLQGTNTIWALERTLVGSLTTNFTPTTVPLSSAPQKFFKAMAYSLDSDSDGLPDWWELKYFGHLGVDPYGNSQGDGWSNLQKYQNGMNPNSYYTPPPPKNVTARVDSSGTNVILTWALGGGTVDHYGIENAYGTEVGTVSGSTLTYTASPGLTFIGNPYGLVGYTIRAYFSNGSHSDSVQVSVFGSSLDRPASLVAGPGRQEYVVVASPPTNLSRVLLFWPLASTGFSTYGSISIYATNFSNGVALLPRSSMAENTNFGGNFYYQLIDVNTNFGNRLFLYSEVPEEQAHDNPYSDNFADARIQMKENLKFLLRSATITLPFGYSSDLGIAGYSGDYALAYPDFYLTRPVGSTNYEYYGTRIYAPDYDWMALQQLRPVQENYLWRNFLFDTNDFVTGAYFDYSFSPPYRVLDVNSFYPYPEHQYSGSGTESPLPLAFTNSTSSWFFARYIYGEPSDGSYDFDNAAELGIVPYGATNGILGSSVRNCYGLPLVSVQGQGSGLILPGHVIPDTADWGGDTYYMNFAAPALDIVGYYFASESGSIPGFGDARPRPPMPGTPDFTVTNTSPALILGIGQSMTVAGWAKEAITNGYTGKYAYLEQYFDKAYKMSTNGTVTTNQTGILSPYGEFFATEPGQTALVTMPDIDTAQRGTGVVNVIKLQLDVNHDGVMDLPLAGPDNTFVNHPYLAWANCDFDRNFYDKDDSTNYEDSVLSGDCPYTPGQLTRDNSYRNASGMRVIPTKRDLQDFSRLWLAGITTNLLTNLPSGSMITLTWGDVGSPNTNNPTIDLFAAADANGGIGYLTNETVASQQTNIALCPYIGRLGPGSSIQLNASTFSNHWAGNYLIWCGAAYGSGALTLTIADASSNVLAQTVAYIQIVDIKQMYERWTVGDNLSIAPTNTARLAKDNFPPGVSLIPFQYSPPSDTNTPYILFVHGWNMAASDKDQFAESAFKRLYWQGYQGRFGVFRWPTGYGFTGLDSIATNINEKDNYDSSEYNGWQSGNGLLNKLEDLNGQYPGHVYLLAHSMGNVVAGEALRLSSSRVVNTYVASQGAISAHTYDTNVANYSFDITIGGISHSFGPDTPNIYGNWFAGNYGGGAGSIVNFYNTNDYALARLRWQLNQLVKPDHDVLEGTNTWTYGYTGSPTDGTPWNNFTKTSGGTTVAFFITTSISARYEVMAYAAESYTTALGATPVSTLAGSVNLNTVWLGDPTGNAYPEHFWHSAEFRGDNPLQGNYWSTLLGVSAFNLK